VAVFQLAMRADGIHVALHRDIVFYWVGHIEGLKGICSARSYCVREQGNKRWCVL
jgi:hypothetical protein